MNNEMKKELVIAELDKIVKEYLFNISSLKKHNYFLQSESIATYKNYRTKSGFDLLHEQNENEYVVQEEIFLEWCTRVFLINPIMKSLLDIYGVKNDWKNGGTFSCDRVSNREYELENYIEFIAVFDDKRVGVRYTPALYSSRESIYMDRDFNFLYKHENIPGFDLLHTVDRVYVIDWMGLSKEEINKRNKPIPGDANLKEVIFLESFLTKYFSEDIFDHVITVAKDAVRNAKDIIALRAIPQLLSNNMLNFKQFLLEELTEEKINTLTYQFKKESTVNGCLSTQDIQLMKDNFFNSSYRQALVGNEDFAKSFITSEYLFVTIKEGLSIDYTAVVSGYIKAIEQLLYLLYVSAFEGNSELIYWDKFTKKAEEFDITKADEFRYDPYDPKQKRKQAKYVHEKKNKKNSPEIGGLTQFLRYYDKMWRVSEQGKEFVVSCLEDYRKTYRNAIFHKMNINASEYASVERIRNNTILCLFYLLGGFNFFDSFNSVEKQLGIAKSKFEELYQEIRQKRICYFYAHFADGTESVLYYLNDDEGIKYNEEGLLPDAKLKFLMFDMTKEDASFEEILPLLEDKQFINKNTIIISIKNMPDHMEAFLPRKYRRTISENRI